MTLPPAHFSNMGMKTFDYSASVEKTDAKTESQRRYRNILANSGKEMESGESRDIANLYVMGRNGRLINVNDLNTNPDKQTEKYKVNLATNHGHWDPVSGERVVEVGDIIGDAKVWTKDGQLYARVYFANQDELADHAWAISDNASYSIGTEWYEDGYYGADESIDGFVGILREISMVDTGNDPRAMTIDHKPTETKAQGSVEAGDGKNINLDKGELEMAENVKTNDELTPDENAAIKREISDLVDRFTTNAPESQTEPTARDSEAEAEPAEAPAEEKKDTLRSPVVIIRDKAVKQEVATTKADWLHGAEGHKAFADTLKKAGRLGATFDSMWRAECEKHMNMDGITGLPNPAPVEQYFADALEKSDGIISHFAFISAKSFRANMLSAATEAQGRANGHKKGDTKVNQSLVDTTRDLLVKMVYKRLDLDATELYENPWLIDFRSRELVDAIIVELERGAIIGDGRTAPEGSDPDLRIFDGTRGLYSIYADATAQSGFGTYVASSATVSGNLYDGVVTARGDIKTEGRQFIVAKSSVITSMLTEKTSNGYLVTPGSRIEDLLGVERVYTPAWMDNAPVDAFLVVDNAYKMVGEQQIRVRTEFDTSTNTDILLDETPRAGSLAEYKSAVAITLGGASE